MKIYAYVFTEKLNKGRNESKLYREVKKRIAKYCVDEEMELYYVPIDSDDYTYLNEIKDYVKENNLGIDIDIYDYTHKYNKSDFNKAAAYCIHFYAFIYGYDTDSLAQYYAECCDNSRWYDEGYCGIQVKDYQVPKSSMGNKKCGMLDFYDYAVNGEVKEDFIKLGATEDDFRPVFTRKGEIVCWQITPQNTIYGFGKDNNMKEIDGCLNCHKKTYLYDQINPYYISEATLKQVGVLNKTFETFGNLFTPRFIVNKETYNYLKAKYPRMRFEPIFYKNEEE